MAKRILYKVRAYHCPRCGSPTEPTKKYCDFCERDLDIRREGNRSRVRMLIDFGNYVYFDEIKQIDTVSTPSIIECTTLVDTRRHFIQARKEDTRFTVDMASNTDRGRELLSLAFSGVHKVRFEFSDRDLSYEQECYISDIQRDYYSDAIGIQKVNFIGVDEMKQGTAIPIDILAELRCPNCGAPIKSRYGACDYCSGWVACEW